MQTDSAVKGGTAKSAILALLTVTIAVLPLQRQQAAPEPLFGLETIFEDGLLLQDRNGDGHIDHVAAHLSLGSAPSDRDVAAAANVAARLGFETAAMNLPLTTATEGVTIAVGRSATAQLAIPPDRLGADLEPGVGVAAVLDREAGPALVVTGGDDVGTAAAALALAARAPHLWDPDGPTFQDVTAATGGVLGAAQIEDASVRVTRFLVDHDTPGLHRLDVEVRVPREMLSRAESALLQAAAPDTAPSEPEAATEVAQAAETAQQPTSLRFDGLRLLRIYLSAVATEPIILHIAGTEDPPESGSGRRPGGGDKTDLDLSNLYTTDGFLGDSDRDLIPDRVDVLLSAAGETSGATADLAARIALEATGVVIPIAVPPEEIDDPEERPPLVLIGGTHPLIGQLVDEEKLSIPELQPGQGLIRVVPKAFDEKPALIVVGADAAGLERAVRQVAERFPNLWERGKDRTTIEDVRHDLWLALSSRSPIGQAASAIYKLDQIAEQLAGTDLENASVSVHVEQADVGFGEFVRDRLAERLHADRLDVTIDNLDVQHAKLLIDETFDVTSEVDEFWRIFHSDVLPRVSSGQAVVVDALLSEPPEIRSQIERRVERELMDAGADPATTSVTVLSAYKQGYSWLYDVVRPALQGQSLDTLLIRFAEIGAPEDWPQQAMYTPTRWLLEIYPIDEVLARELGVDLGRIRFEKMPLGAPTYEVVATAPGGEEILHQRFEPKYVLRPYFDRFPDYEKSRVTTGWITASVGQDTVADRRIITDIERFWNQFQSRTLMQIYDYVMRNGRGKPQASDAPHFGELIVDVSLSEPDYQVGVDQEQIASLEALHEEIYFGVLHFFDVMGRLARGQALNYPGRVIPIVRPRSDGAAGHAKVTFTGFGAAGPMVTVTSQQRGKHAVTERRPIPPVTLDKPTALAALVSAGQPGVDELEFRVKVDFADDHRDEFVLRTSARNVDSRITSAQQVTSLTDIAKALRDAGLYRGELASPGRGTIRLSAYWGQEFAADSQRTASLPANGVPPTFPDIAALRPEGYEWTGETMVQWHTPIPPSEAAEILSKMATFSQATAYQVGKSYLGERIWAMDMMAPVAASHWSQAKASTLKPTVVYSAREHANEVSSTSHVLKLAELILTDPEYAGVLDKVNVVIHPITNPDGAQLQHELSQITPDHMLHAAYLGSLGVNATAGQTDDDPIYPEAKVRPRLWSTWLPDIFLNPHGYPSHEWVQLFSEYAAWVRTRATEQRGWWGMRGWFMPSFNYVDSPDFPDHKAAAFEIRDRITEKINAIPEIYALNRRAYDRYRRYAFQWDSESFKMDFADSVLIYTSITGSSGEGGGTMSNPRVTIWSGVTEAPDEPAHGDWMGLVATAGLEWDKAVLEYLIEGEHEVERTEKQFAGGVSFRLHRPRPPKRKGAEEETG
jgi:hypothetical protein